MSDNKYKFDAFISYRHSSTDSYVAERIHRFLETYKVPRSLVKSVNKSRVKRVFRDREELPITDDLNEYIISSLKVSEYLIVICSPRLKESKWCTKELETFISIHSKSKVLLVLAEGEPEESFPQIMLDNGMEPLAADVRGKNRRVIKKKIKEEALRILAPMIGVDFDALKQRNRERELKKAVIVGTIILAVSLFFSGYIATTAYEISRQSDIIRENQALSLVDQANEYLDSDSRFDALTIAKAALTSYDGVTMPYTSKARYTLTDALRVYDSARYSKDLLEIDAQDTIVALNCNKAPFKVVLLDASGYLAVWDYSVYDKVYESFDGVIGSDNENIAGFIDSDTIYYLDENRNICIVDINDGTKVADLSDSEFDRIFISDNGEYLAGVSHNGIFVYSMSDYALKYDNMIDTANMDIYSYSPYVLLDDIGDRVVFSIGKNGGTDVYAVVDIDTGDVIRSFQYEGGCVYSCIKDDMLYFVSHPSDNGVYLSSICAYDISNDVICWNSQFNGMCSDVILSDYAGILVTAGHDAYYYSAEDGSLINCYSFSDSIGCVDEADNQYFVRILNGECGGISISDGTYTSYGKLIDCTSLRKLESIKVNKYYYAYVGLPDSKNDNQLIFYNYKDNSYAEVYDGEVISPDYIVLKNSEAIERAKSWDVANDSAVYSIIATPEQSFAVISYKNGMIRVYDLYKNTVTDEMDIGATLDKYMGYDIYGNAYYGSDRFSVSIDSSMSVIAGIEDMIGISSDRHNIIMNTVDGNRSPAKLAYKVYSLEELLKLTDETIDYY